MSKGSGGSSMRGKLKQLLGLKKDAAAPHIESKEISGIVFSADILKEISAENNVAHRVKSLSQLEEVVKSRKVEENAIEALCIAINDLLHPSVPMEGRQATLKFMTSLIFGQFNRLGILRAQFFRLVVNHQIREDQQYRVCMLAELTAHGRDVSYCEQIGSFLIDFMDEALAEEGTNAFLTLLINIVHYNASFFEQDDVIELVRKTCDFCRKTRNEAELEDCLRLLDAFVRYAILPNKGIHPLIITLCWTVNVEKFCQQSWKLMRGLVGTRLGHMAIYIMCCILEDDNNINDIDLLRGAIFFIGMCLWGSKRVTSLQHTPMSVLPSFKVCLQCQHLLVANEIAMSVQRLVKKYGYQEEAVTWDVIIDILEQLLRLLDHAVGSDTASLEMNIQSTLTNIEQLYTDHKFEGSTPRFFGIIHDWSHKRPDSSVGILLGYIQSEMLHPYFCDWLKTLDSIMDKYFRKDTRCSVRIKALKTIDYIYKKFRNWYEDEILEMLINYLNDIGNEEDYHVRLEAGHVLVNILLTCSSSKYGDVINCSNMLISQFMDVNGEGHQIPDSFVVKSTLQTSTELCDIDVVVQGLIEAFKMRLFRSPVTHAVQIYEIISRHIINHYTNGCVANFAGKIRKDIFRLLLSLRANSQHNIGTQEDDDINIKYTMYIVCKKGFIEDLPVDQSERTECLFDKGFDAILACLKEEWDWLVLEYVLQKLPLQLQDKALICGGNCNVNFMCSLLCKMLNNRSYLNKIKNCPPRIGIAEFHNLIFPILGVIATYHTQIERQQQYELVRSLEIGLNTQSARTCVICLTISVLEMQQILLRTLPRMLVKLSQISATIQMSIPVLEFLSSLKEIPELYSNFVEEQYMSIFAMALPYTDSHKFSTYTVMLAHYVITAWFTRCRLLFRKGFVRLITKGLQASSSNILERLHLQAETDSSRSLESLEKVKLFHDEMMDVCLDMMTRYSFSLCSSQPQKTEVIEFLLLNGQSQSWLLGNSVVTITTSAGTMQECQACNRKSITTLTGSMDDKTHSKEGVHLIEDYNVSCQPINRCNVVSSNAEDTHFSLRTPDGQEEATPSFSHLITAQGMMSPFNSPLKNKNEQQTSTGTQSFLPRRNSLYDLPSKNSIPKLNKSSSSYSLKLCDNHEQNVQEQRNLDTSTAMQPDSFKLIKQSLLAESDEVVVSAPCSHCEDPTLVPKLGMTGFNQQVFSPSEKLMFSRQSSKSELYDDQVHSDEDSEVENILSALDCDDGICEISTFRQQGTQNEFPLNMSVSGNENDSFKTDILNDDKCNNTETVIPKESLSRSESVSIDTLEAEKIPESSKEVERIFQSEHAESHFSTDSVDQLKKITQTKFCVTGDDESRNTICTSADCTKVCNCHCDGWAEVLIRRPTGNIAWLLKLENLENQEKLTYNQLSCLVASMNGQSLPEKINERINSNESSRKRSLSITASDTRTESGSSGGMFPELTTNNRRRRFSTGSLELPNYVKPILGISPGYMKNSNTANSNIQAMDDNKIFDQELKPTDFEGTEIIGGHIPNSVSQHEYISSQQQTITRPRGATMCDLPSYQKGLKNFCEASPKNNTMSDQRENDECSCRSYLNPFFLFLQLFYSPHGSFAGEKPIILENNEVIERAIKMLDRLPAFDTHKFGVIYVGKSQTDEIDILANEFGSTRYLNFVSGLGSLIKIADASPTDIYTGGLDKHGSDGLYAYHWKDDTTQVIFHTTTLMPNKVSDPACHSKKLHVGNDFVTIVYDESQDGYSFGTIKGQFNFAEVVVRPSDYNSNVVFVRVKDSIREHIVVNNNSHVISDKNLPSLVRQLAIHTNMATVLESSSKRATDAYGGNWLERLRQIKRIKSKALPDREQLDCALHETAAKSLHSDPSRCDFTEFCIV